MTTQGYRIYKTSFEAAHYIEGHVKCGSIHGHSFNLTVKLFEKDLKHWIDFEDIKKQVDMHLIKTFDHKNLGNITCEEIAIKISEFLLSKRYTGSIQLNETNQFGIEILF